MDKSKEAITKANKILHDLNFEKSKTTTQIVAEGLESYAPTPPTKPVTDAEIDKQKLLRNFVNEIFTNTAYHDLENRKIVDKYIKENPKWMRDKAITRTALPRAGEKKECKHDFKFYYGTTPTDRDVWRCKKCGNIEYESPD